MTPKADEAPIVPWWKKALSSFSSPSKQMETMNGIHEERATLGGNQASPTIITTDTTTASVQSNPLTFVAGATHTRGKPIPTSR